VCPRCQTTATLGHSLRTPLRAANQPAGQRVGGHAVTVGLDAVDEGVLVTLDPLLEPPAPAREVIDHLGSVNPHVLQVDDNDVRTVARGKLAPVVQADHPRRVTRLPLEDELHWQLAVRTVAHPVLEERAREAAVADRADMRAAIAQTGQRIRVGQHRANRIQVALEVVRERLLEQAATVVTDDVVGQLLGRTTLAIARLRIESAWTGS
jgi:hypothetical protein